MNRREMMKLGAGAFATAVPLAAHGEHSFRNAASHSGATAEQAGAGTIEQWGIFEVALQGPSEGNPFIEVTLSAEFRNQHRTVSVTGFYDGNGTYRVRFMPDATGDWSYITTSSTAALHGKSGSFRCTSASSANHGPVHVAHQFHFQYADGTPYFPFGTTTYSYLFTCEPYDAQTIAALMDSPFNKVRVCILPKGQGKRGLPEFPFEHAAGSISTHHEDLKDNSQSNATFDCDRLNPRYFQLIERRLLELQKLGVEADLILFHPYDSWGFKAMTPEQDDRYLRYAIARFAAYRSVWWAIANEYDLVKTKSMADWDRFFRITVASDPYSHLRSIHHSKVIYDHSKPWCTHASLQEYDFQKSAERRAAWNKPLVYDEIQYEGNIARRWGNLSAEEMTRRFWLATVHGVYASHGETYKTPAGEPVWSDGGKLRGASAPRIAFLRKLLERVTPTGVNEFEDAYYPSAGKDKELYLYYFDFHCVGEYDFPLPAGMRFKATLIDPWNMSERELPGVFTGKSTGSRFVDENAGDQIQGGTNHIELTGKPYMAVLFQKV
ncbi:DUF5060 domain-containing protein [Terriglobus sp. 2YAB30_2]|uniref:DUF5060 domain-containing protein n=1 Tax=unclassified Terriglobus TaxID=2628988 RepID=UPI003F9A41F1